MFVSSRNFFNYAWNATSRQARQGRRVSGRQVPAGRYAKTKLSEPSLGLWQFRAACSMLDVVARGAFTMVDKCSDAHEPAAAAPAPEKSARTVRCVKFGKEMPGLERIPWKGELGKRVFENVSQEAWKMWIEHSKMVMNEYRLNPLDPNSQKIMEQQMEQFFFGEGARLPEGYVPPKTKS
jgi:Fe-S cluster biosynthesis and repair protein YggX